VYPHRSDVPENRPEMINQQLKAMTVEQ